MSEPSDSQARQRRLERMRHARASLPGEQRDGAGRQKSGGVHSRGYLPHIEVAGAAYFVTFRLADSIPASVAARMERDIENDLLRQRERWRLRQRPADEPAADDRKSGESFDELQARHRAKFAVLDRWLDAGHGACWMRRADVADVVAAALKFFADERYHLMAWCVMANHVHAVFRPAPQWSLSKILHSWKSFTAKEAAKLIGPEAAGRFWMPESYNHWCRDDGEIARCCRYNRINPVKAKLCATPEDWPWSGP